MLALLILILMVIASAIGWIDQTWGHGSKKYKVSDPIKKATRLNTTTTTLNRWKKK